MELADFLRRFNIQNWETKHVTENRIESSVKTNGYEYIERLLSTPVSDGRHRIIWLILTPYLINVKKLSEEDASMLIMKYIDKCNELTNTNAIDRLQYYIQYATVTGLMPPKLVTLQQTEPDLYNIITKAIGETQHAD
jgi:hypothetical protein